MKKLIALILALVMMLSLAACGNDDTPDQTTGENETTGSSVQTKPTDTGVGNDDPVVSDEITLENLMKAAESPESDFECVDHGNGDVELLRYLGSSEIVVIPETWNGKKITTISSFVFANNSPVKAIRLSDSITNLMMSSFAMNKSLEIVVCGSGLTTIGEGAFQECSSLHTVVLNDGLVTISGASFGGCKSLTELEIPESVTEIQPMTFYNRPENFKIIGKAGSAAEQHATDEGITFEAK